ncbi:hypothetical protein HKD37_14G039440 [Glycine soja]
MMRRRTCLRRGVVAGAAKLCRVERCTRALARHHRAGAVSDLQLRRTNAVHVRHAPRVLAVTGSAGSPHAHAHIVTVDKAHVVEVLVAVASASDGEFRQSHRRNTAAGAPQSAGAVSGGAFSGTGAVEAAPCPGPKAAGPAGRRDEPDCRTGCQGETASAENGDTVAGKCAGPNCVTAMIFQGKHCRICYIACKYIHA